MPAAIGTPRIRGGFLSVAPDARCININVNGNRYTLRNDYVHHIVNTGPRLVGRSNPIEEPALAPADRQTTDKTEGKL